MRRQTRHAGSQGDEGDGIHAVLEIDEASEMTGDVTDDSSVATDEENGYHKSWITLVNC